MTKPRATAERAPVVVPGAPSEGAQHWDAVHATRAPTDLSWYQERPATSVRLITGAAKPEAAVVDIGAGQSLLADTLLDAGWRDVTVLDVSRTAVARVRDRLAGHGEAASFVVTDVLAWEPHRTFDVWHDRAVFHFLITAEQQQRYVATASAAVRPGGVLVLGVFAADGPTACSGLPTARYDPDELAEVLADGFDLEHAEREEHRTPGGGVQPFTWAVLRRKARLA